MSADDGWPRLAGVFRLCGTIERERDKTLKLYAVACCSYNSPVSIATNRVPQGGHHSLKEVDPVQKQHLAGLWGRVSNQLNIM